MFNVTSSTLKKKRSFIANNKTLDIDKFLSFLEGEDEEEDDLLSVSELASYKKLLIRQPINM